MRIKYFARYFGLAAVLLTTIATGQVTPVKGSAPEIQPAKKRFFRDRKAAPSRPKDIGQGIQVVNAASFLPGVSPGGLATVFGTNLTDVTGVVEANSNPFPTILANVSVTVNGVYAPIFSIAYANGLDQISFAVPWSTVTGPGAAYVKVYDYGTLVGSLVVDSYIEDPGIFGFQQFGNTYAVALHASDYALVTPDDPAVLGEVLVLYVTGLGPVNQDLPDGWGAPSNPPAYTLDPYRVILAGESVSVFFSGLAPGYVGLYQLNIQLPRDLPAGDLNLQITSDYANSQSVLLSVR